jgi:hypothetical protein
MSQTCSHIYDTGGLCKAFAVKGQRYCVHHLRYRARRLQAAQSRARGERFEFNLPPLESMHAVQSALSQLAQAIACDVIDCRSAHLLLSVLRVASSNLRHPEKWQPNLYESAEPAPDVDVSAEYDLPDGLDIDTHPDVAFPPLPLDDVAAAPPLPPDSTPSSDPFRQLNVLERVTPVDIELEEIRLSQGSEAMLRRADRFEREELRRRRRAETRAAYQRYAVVAFHRNLERLAQKMAAEKLAGAPSGPSPAAPKPPSSVPASYCAGVPERQASVLNPTG